MGFVPSSFAPIAVATRSGFDESLHHGAGVVLDQRGGVTAAVGDPHLVVYPRSALKPLQAMAMIELGLDLPDDLLALACASHDGRAVHLDGVRRLLARFDLTEDDLDNTPARPLSPAARHAARLAGVEPSSLQQNCSGKHAAMLATCRVNGWPTEGYADPDHALQQHILGAIDVMAGDVAHVGVDGCGAPTHAVPLSRLAAAFAGATAPDSTVGRAMRGWPELVGGPERDVTIWMSAVPGLVAKEGAAGVMALALPDGRAAAYKIADGSDDARRAVTTEALRRMGLDVDGALAGVAAEVAVPTLGHGHPVGELRALNWAG